MAAAYILKEPTVTLNAPLPPEAPAKPKTSGLAIASLILGIVGPCTVGLASIVGVILGIVGLVKIGKSAGQLGGRGLAIAGLVVSGIGVVILPFLVGAAVAILIPAVVGTREVALNAASANNVMQLCKAAHIYTTNHKDEFPAADSWPDALKELVMVAQVAADPADPNGGRAYAINAAVAGKRLASVRQPSETVLFFECAAGAPPAGGPTNLPPTPRHARRYVIGFCDGHVETIPKEDLDRLIWNPTGERPNE